MNEVTKRSQHENHWLAALDTYDLALIATLMLFLISGPSIWYVNIIVTLAAIFGITMRRIRHWPVLWFVIFSCLIFECYKLWYLQDNHKYLIAYWCLAIGLCQSVESTTELLTSNGRFLIGACFGVAVINKLISPTYIEGTFFQHTLIFDSRFHAVARNVVGVSDEILESNNRKYAELVSTTAPQDGDTAIVRCPDNLKIASWILTIWTLVIESAIAVSFLTKVGSRWRNVFLAIFILSTYAVANVFAFGWILATIGIAQLGTREKSFAIINLALIGLLNIYRAPWAMIVFEL